MSKRKLLVLIGLLIVPVAAVLLGLQRQSNAGRPEVAANASGHGAGVVNRPSSFPTSFAGATTSRRHSTLTSPQAVIAGGAGAGKARPSSPVKVTRTPEAPSEVLEAAETGLPFFLGRIPPGSKELYGFALTDDVSAARLGGPLRMLTIKPAAIEESLPSATVSSLLSETSMWFFPILIESESKAMLVVDRDDSGKWKAVSLGYAGLGHELNELLAQWPESKEFHPQLIAVFQAKQFYFTIPEIDDFNLTKVRQRQGEFSGSTMSGLGRQAQPGTYAILSAVSNSLEELKPIVLRAQNYLNR